MASSDYSDEFISAREAMNVYSWSFDELMVLADRGEVRRVSRQGANGGVTYLFRRGDIIKLNAEVADD